MQSSSLRRAVACLFLAVLGAAALAGETALTLDPPFADGMVIQRDREIPVRGRCPGAKSVVVRFAGREKSAFPAGPDGAFEALLGPVSAGGPRTLTVSATNGATLMLRDVLVGEVWLCSGQSNMVWPLSRTDGGSGAARTAKDPGIRLLTVPRRALPEPTREMTARWARCSPKAAASFSAVAYHFGRELRRRLKVPIGLIQSAVGGTPIEAWTPGRNPPGVKVNARSPAALYNGMIAPIEGHPIRGVIWYQGESNARRAEAYRSRFPAMIRAWRDRWGREEMPFLFVQLANYGKDRPGVSSTPWAELRDAQLHTLKTVPHTGMAVTIDIGDPKNIHPRNKKDVGLRLARWALADCYGRKVVRSGPIYRDHATDGDRVIVSFDHVGRGLVLRGGGGFLVAGADGVFHPGRAKIEGKTVVVTSPEVPEPKSVRYAWANCPPATLFNRDGLPASPFRTDGE